jgi:hypothetical protein
MDKRWLAGLMLGCSMAVFAGSGQRTTMKDAEASMLLTGTINVDPKGAVTGFTIDHRDKVPGEVVQLVDGIVPQWRFQPVTHVSQPAGVKTTMSILVVATQPDDTHYSISVDGATFGDDSADNEEIKSKSMKPPRYPAGLGAGASGVAYLILRIDQLGKVANVMVEQVNLRVLGTQGESDNFRKQFADSAMRAAKRWTFTVPAVAAPDDEGLFSVRVPVDYRCECEKPIEYGKWQAYIPGPRQTIPWLHQDDMDRSSPPDALAAGGVYQVGGGLHLLTPLGEG